MLFAAAGGDFGSLFLCIWVMGSLCLVFITLSVSVTPDYVPPFANVDLATLDMIPWSGSAVSTKNRNKGKMGEYIAILSLSEPH